ncbi:MAG: patatin-like phospholipase family protein, partial [Candidatus Aegiribacteria sp.]
MNSSLVGRFRNLLGRKGRKERQGKGIGVALGGGGAKGLAHITMLELMDDMGIRPACIAGTSIGAVIGALYASGMPGAEIRSLVDDTIIKKGDSPNEVLKNIKKIIHFMDVDFLGSGIFKGDSFMDYFYDEIKTDSFEELEIPLKVVATDFWKSEQVVLSSGDLIAAVKASMGLPGIFTPVEIDGRVLIDGGGVNPVPWDVLDE